jgi:hypothetical protein
MSLFASYQSMSCAFFANTGCLVSEQRVQARQRQVEQEFDCIPATLQVATGLCALNLKLWLAL